MKNRIISSLPDPEALEKLYRDDKEAFTDAFPYIAEENDSDLVRFWKLRLEPEMPRSAGSLLKSGLLVALFIAGVVAILSRLPAIFTGIDEDWFYFRNLAVILFAGLIAFTLWQRKTRDLKTILMIALPIGVLALYLNLMRDSTADTSALAFIHAPLFLWCFFGLAWFTLDFRNSDKVLRVHPLQRGVARYDRTDPHRRGNSVGHDHQSLCHDRHGHRRVLHGKYRPRRCGCLTGDCRLAYRSVSGGHLPDRPAHRQGLHPRGPHFRGGIPHRHLLFRGQHLQKPRVPGDVQPDVAGGHGNPCLFRHGTRPLQSTRPQPVDALPPGHRHPGHQHHRPGGHHHPALRRIYPQQDGGAPVKYPGVFPPGVGIARTLVRQVPSPTPRWSEKSSHRIPAGLLFLYLYRDFRFAAAVVKRNFNHRKHKRSH